MLRLAVRVRRERAEIVLAELLELAPGGVEEVGVDAETVEYAVYGAPGEVPELPQLEAVAGGELVMITTEEIADDWADRWREFHRPLRLGGRLGVRPPWEPELGTDVEIVIDPGRAFGTGAHPTTKLCLELLLDLPDAGPTDATPVGGPSVVDLGCGSGVLAIAAIKLGWPDVLALDYDPLSVDATIENAHVNGVAADQISVRRFDLGDEDVPGCRLALANLLGPLLLRWCERLAAVDHTRPQRIIASGLLASEADQISAAFAALGYAELTRAVEAEWGALLLAAPDSV